MEKKKPPYLPSELVTEILVWLPVKSLIRFKCVSKSWFSLISDSNFANSHFELTATHTRRILSLSSVSLKIQSIDFESSLNHEYTSLTLNLASSFPLEIKGSCRGFLFLRHDSKFYLWNPSTGFHKQIPTSPFHSKFNDKANGFTCLYGFGYDQSRDDYLLVLFKTKHGLSSHLEFFSLRNNTWKEIKDTHFRYSSSPPYHNPKPGCLFNGAIHWLTFRHDLMKGVIVIFDLIERKLLEMNLPDELDHHIEYCNLWVFGEFLSIWALSWGLSYSYLTLNVWVMKDRSSWTRTPVLINVAICTFFPICSTKSGDIIGRNYRYGLVRCNDKGQRLEYQSHNDIQHGSEVAVYTESLLSLPGDCEQI